MDDKHYRITWDIDIWADNPRDAAIQAETIQLDPYSTASVYKFKDLDSGQTGTVDLLKSEN